MAKEYPMTFDEFERKFATENDCRDYLFGLRFPTGFVCPKCGGSKYWRIVESLYECTDCGHQTSVMAGTIFQDSKKPLRTWFIAVWWITTQKYGASATGLKQVLGLKSDKTAWTWLHKIRKAMVFPNRTKLNSKVEVDETYVGGDETDGKSGRGTENKTLVVIALEIGGNNALGRVRMKVIADASAESLRPFIINNVEKGTEVVTDGWSGYAFVNKEGYKHTVFVQKKAKYQEEMLPHCHLIISLLKRWLLGTHQGAVTEKYFQAYLDEYVFRFNRRKSAERGLLFYRFLECAMMTPPTTYEDLVNPTKISSKP